MMPQTQIEMTPWVRKNWIVRFATLLLGLAGHLSLHAQVDAQAVQVKAAPDVPMALIYALVAVAVIQVVFILSLSSIMRTMGTGAWASRGRGVARASILAPLLAIAANANAQAYSGGDGAMSGYHLFWWLLCANIFLFMLILFQVNLLRGMIKGVAGETRSVISVAPAGPTWDQRLLRRLTRQVTVEKEQDILMHHEYDGIRELDNVLPPWWVWLFYGTIAWSVVYLFNVHVIDIWPDQKTEYRDEMAQSAADVAAYKATLGNIVDENTVTLSTDEGVLSSGKALFTQYCTPCHGADAAGSETSVGPNLTDAFWLHGGGVKNVFKTINYGVPAKGMISWKSQLKPAEIAALSSYIISLQGKGPATQKAPQGELWKDEAAPGDSLSVPGDTVRVAMN